MVTRSTAALATGTANTAKLFVAALAFTAAYVGVSAYDTAASAPATAKSITLSARTTPVTAPARLEAEPGTVRLGPPVAEAGCARTYEAAGVAVNRVPGRTAFYTWRLTRWIPRTNTWRTYLVEHGGFAAAEQTVTWHPRLTGSTGWYRVELAVEGAGTVKSRRFQVTC